jgi:hypothetical protein
VRTNSDNPYWWGRRQGFGDDAEGMDVIARRRSADCVCQLIPWARVGETMFSAPMTCTSITLRRYERQLQSVVVLGRQQVRPTLVLTLVAVPNGTKRAPDTHRMSCRMEVRS